MTPSPLPMKGRNAGVYGFLDGNRGLLGVFGCKRGEGMTSPLLPENGEER